MHCLYPCIPVDWYVVFLLFYATNIQAKTATSKRCLQIIFSAGVSMSGLCLVKKEQDNKIQDNNIADKLLTARGSLCIASSSQESQLDCSQVHKSLGVK